MNIVPDPLSPLVLLAYAILGRVLLSWLPPGHPGGSAPRELAATWGASVLLGHAALPLVLGASWTWSYVGLGLVVVLALSRLLSRPLGLTPRHEPPLDRESPVAKLSLAVAWLATIACLVAHARAEETPTVGNPWIAGGLVLALAAVIDWALETARCRAWARAAAIAALGAVVFVAPVRLEDSPAAAAVHFAAGAACTIAWYRRADRRALTLAAVMYAAPIVFAAEGWLLAAAGVLVLAVGTPAMSRRFVLFACAVPIAAFGALRLLAPPQMPLGEPTTMASALYFVIGVLFSAVFVARYLDLRRIGIPAWNPSGAAPGHERAMLLRTLLFALILAWLARAMKLEVRADFALMPGLFVLVLLFGSSLDRIRGRA
jgi:hypothetical protein